MSIRLTSVLILAMCVTACGGYNSPSAPSTGPTLAAAGSTTVNIAGGASTLTTTAFGQNPLTIAVGTTISWLNDDSITHTSDADANQWSSGNIPPGGRFNSTFPSAGRFTYHCQIHPNMVGTIVVQ
jgi:plastocyanin